MKRIALQAGLSDLGNKLKEAGYEVVDFKTAEAVDAVVYTDDYQGIASINNQQDSSYGAILINANGKSLEDIKYIIEKRRYGGLFT